MNGYTIEIIHSGPAWFAHIAWNRGPHMATHTETGLLSICASITDETPEDIANGYREALDKLQKAKAVQA